MINVKEIIEMESGFPVLVCDLFDDEDVTNHVKTSIGLFEKSDFAVGTITACFAPPSSRTILLKTNKDCSSIKEIEFV